MSPKPAASLTRKIASLSSCARISALVAISLIQPACSESANTQQLDDAGAVASPATDAEGQGGISDLALQFGSGFEYGPFDFYANEAARQYRGRRAEAVINSTAAGELIYALLYGPGASSEAGQQLTGLYRGLPHFITYKTRSGIGMIRGNHCTEKYARLINVTQSLPDAELDRGIRPTGLESTLANRASDMLMLFDRCPAHHYGDERYTGIMRLFVPVPASQRPDGKAGYDAHAYIAYDNLLVETNNRSFKLTGVEKFTGSETCPSAGPRTAFLLIEDVSDGSQILYADLRASHAFRGIEDCTAQVAQPSEYRGTLLHSRFGRAIVDTSIPLGYEYRDNYAHYSLSTGILDPSSPVQGEISVLGKSSKLTFRQFRSDNVINGRDTVPLAELVVEGSAVGYQRYWSLLSEFGMGLFRQLSDSDWDGMPDGWEITYGLDPLDAGDASVDSDLDGLVNLDEFRAAGIPSDDRDKGARHDRSISLRVEAQPGTSRAPVEGSARISVDYGFRRFHSAAESIDVTIDGGARWRGIEDLEQCTFRNQDRSWVSCEMELPGASGLPGTQYLSFVSDTPGEFSVTAKLAEVGRDGKAEDDMQTASASVTHVTSDYSITAPESATLHDSEFGKIEVAVEQAETYPQGKAKIIVELPFGVKAAIEPWPPYSPDYELMQCDLGGWNFVGCVVTGLRAGGKAQTRVYFRVEKTGVYTVTLRVESGLNDRNESNNTAITRLYVN